MVQKQPAQTKYPKSRKMNSGKETVLSTQKLFIFRIFLILFPLPILVCLEISLRIFGYGKKLFQKRISLARLPASSYFYFGKIKLLKSNTTDAHQLLNMAKDRKVLFFRHFVGKG